LLNIHKYHHKFRNNNNTKLLDLWQTPKNSRGGNFLFVDDADFRLPGQWHTASLQESGIPTSASLIHNWDARLHKPTIISVAAFLTKSNLIGQKNLFQVLQQSELKHLVLSNYIMFKKHPL